jgi:ParB-like chromosome segregation protein Spo0J
VITRIEQVPVSKFIVPDQFRKDLGPEEDLRNLGENILKNGLLQLVGALANWEMLYGFRRLAAAKLVGIKTLETRIYDKPLSKLEQQCLNLSENVHRLDVCGYDKWKACEEMLSQCSTWTAKDLAEYLNLDPSAISKLLSPSKCIPAWQEALHWLSQSHNRRCWSSSWLVRTERLCVARSDERIPHANGTLFARRESRFRCNQALELS